MVYNVVLLSLSTYGSSQSNIERCDFLCHLLQSEKQYDYAARSINCAYFTLRINISRWQSSSNDMLCLHNQNASFSILAHPDRPGHRSIEHGKGRTTRQEDSHDEFYQKEEDAQSQRTRKASKDQQTRSDIGGEHGG